jgi:DNA-directed RNA polymerase specialized sigma24 family protein
MRPASTARVSQLPVNWAQGDVRAREALIPLAYNELRRLPQQQELDLLVLNDALEELAELDPHLSRIVELRFFGGLSIEETSVVLEISPATVKRNWAQARAWLWREIKKPKARG